MTSLLFALLFAGIAAFAYSRRRKQRRPEFEAEAIALVVLATEGVLLKSIIGVRGGIGRHHEQIVHLLINRDSMIVVENDRYIPLGEWRPPLSLLAGSLPNGFSKNHFNEIVRPTSLERRGSGVLVLKGFSTTRTPLFTSGFDAPESPFTMTLSTRLTEEELDRRLSEAGIRPNIFERVLVPRST